MTRLLPLLALLVACDETSYSYTLRCDVSLSAIAPAEAAPGETVTLTGAPFTHVWDTAVYLDQTRVPVSEVDRDTCDACDECRDEQGCTECVACDACAIVCESTCVETTSFVVPELPSGEVAVRLFNVHGQSTPLTLTVLSDAVGGETGATETGTTETGTTETGTAETGTTETGATETGTAETADTSTL